jgi:hypothetical protein
MAGGKSDNPSRERESCSASSDCAEGLRCVDGSCAQLATSRLGEYHWVSGEVALERGKIADAVESFQLATTQFDTDKVTAPAGLLCSYGAALRRMKGDQKAGEQAARLLHRCLIASAPGTADHMRALRELVELEPLGLEPNLIARDEPADTYLVRAPRRPPTENLKIEVAQSEPSRDKGYGAWVAILGGDEVKKRLVPCFEKYWNEAQKEKLTVAMPLRLKAIIGDDDLYVGGTLEIGTDPSATGAAATASSCIRDALAPLAIDFAKSGSSGSWRGSVTLTLSAGG